MNAHAPPRDPERRVATCPVRPASARPYTVAVMQPYFCPYLGYFQLVAAADVFVVYDNIEYTKKGWINRNRILKGAGDAVITVPLQRAPDTLHVRDRRVAPDFDRRRLLNRILEAYRKAPHLDATWAVVERIVLHDDPNLFRFLLHSLEQLKAHLCIATPLRISSTVDVDHGLRAQDKVLALCERLGAERYLNAIGGLELYRREDFAARGIELRFLRPRLEPYPQLGGPFVSALSILDVLMFNPLPVVQDWIAGGYDLV